MVDDNKMSFDILKRSIWVILGAISIVFHLWLIFSGLIPNLVSRPLHMALVVPWIFLFNATSDRSKFVNWGFTLVGVGACLWIALNNSALLDQYGYLGGGFQTVIAVVLLITVLEMARRAIGWPLPLLAVSALLYGLFGQNIPGEFGHPGTPLMSFLGTMVIAEGGIWGSLTGVSVSIVAVFVIFGAVLNAGEAGAGFMNVASYVAGRLRGGAAKVSVLSSALFGSISGSASANVASTGMVTLPAMVGLGYPKRIAAAVEAVASSGGQIMPPPADGGRRVCNGGTDRHSLFKYHNRCQPACFAVFLCCVVWGRHICDPLWLEADGRRRAPGSANCFHNCVFLLGAIFNFADRYVSRLYPAIRCSCCHFGSGLPLIF